MPDGNEFSLSRQDAELDVPILPHPEVIEKLNACRPDLIDWMIKEASMESAKRRELDEKINNTACSAYRRGQWLGFAIGLAGITGGSLVAIFSSSPVVGGTIATAAIVVLAVAFLRGKRE